MLETVAAGDIDYGQYGIVRAVLWEYGQYCGSTGSTGVSTGSTGGVRAVRVLVPVGVYFIEAIDFCHIQCPIPVYPPTSDEH